MATDSARRSRDAIVSVLTEYGVSFWDGKKGTGTIACIEFQHGGEVQQILYSGGDQHGAQKAKVATRRKLEALGIQRPLDPEPELPPDPPPVVIQPLPIPEPPAVENPPDANEPPRFADDGYVIYQHSRYFMPGQPVGYIAVHIPHGLIVEEGNLLCIPLHKPDEAWSLTEDEFRRHFVPQKPAPVSENPLPVVRHPDSPPVEDETVEPEFTGAEPTTSPTVSFPTSQPSANPFRLLVGPFGRQPRVTPQVGRVLVALYNLHHTGREHISAKALQSYMRQSDKDRVSTALSYAIRYKLVDRIKRGTVFEWFLSEEGIKAVQQVGTWPWDEMNLSHPKWLRALVDHNA